MDEKSNPTNQTDMPDQSAGPSETPGAMPTVSGPKPQGKKMMMWVSIALAVLLAGGGALYYFMQKDKTPAPVALAKVKVGILLPFSGTAAGAGFGPLKGVQLAKKQLKADNVELVQVDSQCDKDEAAKVIQELIAQKVVAIIGEACSGASLGVLPIANENKIPMVSPSASSSSLTIKDDYFFRVVPPDEFQGKFTAQLLYNEGYKNVSVLHSDEDYGNSLAEVFTAEIVRLGGKVVSDGSYTTDATDVSSQVAAMKAAKPQAVYFITNSLPPAIAAVKLARDSGVTVPFYGADSFNTNAFLSETGAAGEDFIATTFSSGTKAFKQNLTNEYPSEEFLYAAAEGYDAFQAIFEALKTGATTGEQVKLALEKVDFQGVSGRIKFNANGEVTEAEHAYDTMLGKDGTFIPTTE